jgi:pectate lyase
VVLAWLGPWAGPAVGDGFPWKTYAKKDDAWFRSDEGARRVDNVLSHQSSLGDWPKNQDASARPFEGDRAKLRGTFDNDATVGEVRFLARAFRATGDARSRAAVEKAVDHILEAQYPTGGWPQSSPPGKGYARYITFNDGTTANLMELLRDVARSPELAFLGDARRRAATRAFDAGVACILKCQVAVEGRKTVWCAQHDETTLEPRPARAFELVSLSGGESAGILLLLMSLDDPSPDVVRAVYAGTSWFERAKLTGIRVTTRGVDRVVAPDANAPPVWARFYEIETNRPFFCGRDGVKKYALSEIEAERRNGYAWYGDWGARVAQRFAAWRRDHPEPAERRID